MPLAMRAATLDEVEQRRSAAAVSVIIDLSIMSTIFQVDKYQV
jgi:hypothetical protein